MSLMTETTEWILAEKPGPDDIRQTIDNLAHQHASSSPEQRSELIACIAYLCQLLNLDAAAVVLSESEDRAASVALDASPLVLHHEVWDLDHAVDAAAKRERFRELRESLMRPF
jgi:hypothetical protein